MKKTKKIPYLDYESKVGEKVQWDSINGEHNEGILKEWREETIAVIELSDGTLKNIKC